MRELVRRLLSAEDRFEIFLRPGRCGWIVTTPLEFRLARARARSCCLRVLPVHLKAQGSSRLFLEPRWSVLAAALECRTPPAPPELFSPAQKERLRRLSLSLDGPPSNRAVPRSGQALFCALALRLESLAVSPRADGLWRHLISDFDRLWSTVPLFAVRLTPFQRTVVRALRQAAGLPCLKA